MVSIEVPLERSPAASLVFGHAKRPILIAIPFYKNEALVASVVGSLIACAADLAAIGAEAIFFNDSPDHAPLAAALDAILPCARAAFPCRIVANPENLGFVKTMNLAIGQAVERGSDILLLNSDTIVTPGALTEMARVAALDPMIAFVNPRSNNATLTTLPVPTALLEQAPERGPAAYAALAARLPVFSYSPTAVGFCLLIRWSILAEFGGFDEIYGHGYNEENDLVMRAGRCGYRVVLANRAFVWHESETSFSSAGVTKSAWEPINRAILDKRYPEYGSFTSAHFNAPETHAEVLLGTLTPDRTGRLDLAFDFSTFAPIHNGTYQAGRQLLAAAMDAWGDRFDIHVLCSEPVYDFHGYAAIGAPRREPHGPERFAVIFRVGQPYDWNTLQRLVMKAAVIGIYMLDTISIDCTQLTSPTLFNLWQFALSHSDLVVALSRQTGEQLNHRFQIPDAVIQMSSLLSLDLADYALGGAVPRPAGVPGTLLVLGNHFPHKYTAPTANALAAAFPDRAVVALGQTKPGRSAATDPLAPHGLGPAGNLTGLAVGTLSDAELAGHYAEAEAIVFPSHYEGFGIPVLNALAARRPLYVRRLPVFGELWESLARNPNIHFYETTEDLIRQLRDIEPWDERAPSPAPGNGVDRSAREIREGLEAALAQVDYRRIVDRVRAVQFPDQVTRRTDERPVPGEPVALFLAVRVERMALWLFDQRMLFAAVRLVARTIRGFVRLLRGR
jgi:GT2 family glycosyltransferase/glycosyltransferase involved in cell wall biosynthesis